MVAEKETEREIERARERGILFRLVSVLKCADCA